MNFKMAELDIEYETEVAIMCEDTFDKAPPQRLPKCVKKLLTKVVDYVELANERAKEEHTDVGTKDVYKSCMSEINERIGWMGHDHDNSDNEAASASTGEISHGEDEFRSRRFGIDLPITRKVKFSNFLK